MEPRTLHFQQALKSWNQLQVVPEPQTSKVIKAPRKKIFFKDTSIRPSNRLNMSWNNFVVFTSRWAGLSVCVLHSGRNQVHKNHQPKQSRKGRYHYFGFLESICAPKEKISTFKHKFTEGIRTHIFQSEVKIHIPIYKSIHMKRSYDNQVTFRHSFDEWPSLERIK